MFYGEIADNIHGDGGRGGDLVFLWGECRPIGGEISDFHVILIISYLSKKTIFVGALIILQAFAKF